MNNKSDSFMADLIQNRYHLFDVEKAEVKGYYPKELLAIIREIAGFNRSFPIENGEVYAARAFFAISAPIGSEVEYQSGYLDLKLSIQEKDNYIGEVMTTLPPHFVLKKGAKIKLQKSNILYKPDYSSIRKK
jgi:hypothetical protein